MEDNVKYCVKYTDANGKTQWLHANMSEWQYDWTKRGYFDRNTAHRNKWQQRMSHSPIKTVVVKVTRV